MPSGAVVDLTQSPISEVEVSDVIEIVSSGGEADVEEVVLVARPKIIAGSSSSSSSSSSERVAAAAHSPREEEHSNEDKLPCELCGSLIAYSLLLRHQASCMHPAVDQRDDEDRRAQAKGRPHYNRDDNEEEEEDYSSEEDVFSSKKRKKAIKKTAKKQAAEPKVRVSGGGGDEKERAQPKKKKKKGPGDTPQLGSLPKAVGKKTQEEKEADEARKQREKQARQEEGGDRWWAEIACILPCDVTGQDPFLDSIRKELDKGYQHGTKPAPRFHYFEDKECITKYLFRWTWRSSADGGCSAIVPEGVLHRHAPRVLELAFLVFPTKDFVMLALRNCDNPEDNFSALGSTVQGIIDGLAAKGEPYRLVLLVENFKRYYQQVATERFGGNNLAVERMLQDALAFLSFEYRIDCIKCESREEVLRRVLHMTRTLGKMLYESPTHNLSCVVKRKPSGDGANALRSIWQNMLCCVSGLSDSKAKALTSDKRFSCPKDLIQSLITAPNPKSLLESAFDQGGARTYSKLASTVATLLLSNNPKETL
jgi:hypothetical protein